MPRFDEDDLPEYQISVTDVADMEIDALYLTKMRYGQRTAEKWYAGLWQAFETISRLPRGFAVAPDSKKLGGNVRQMVYGKGSGAVRILYRAIEPTDSDPGIIWILRVRNASRLYYGESDDA